MSKARIQTVSIGKRKDKMLKEIIVIATNMFEQLEKMVDMTIISYENKDIDIALQVVDEDHYLDQLQKDLIVEINHFIIREQPKATDLRVALGTFTLASDIERLGDYFKGYAKLQLKELEMSEKQLGIFLEAIIILKQQINETKAAYLAHNHQLAKIIANRDEGTMNRLDKLMRELSKDLLTCKTQEEINKTVKIILQIRTLSRANSHLTSICEQISYIANGQIYHYS